MPYLVEERVIASTAAAAAVPRTARQFNEIVVAGENSFAIGKVSDKFFKKKLKCTAIIAIK